MSKRPYTLDEKITDAHAIKLVNERWDDCRVAEFITASEIRVSGWRNNLYRFMKQGDKRGAETSRYCIDSNERFLRILRAAVKCRLKG